MTHSRPLSPITRAVCLCVGAALGLILTSFVNFRVDSKYRNTAPPPAPMTHEQALADGWTTDTDGYWEARTGLPLDLTPQPGPQSCTPAATR